MDIEPLSNFFLIVGTLLFFVLLAFSAFFSGSETALTSMTKLRVKRLLAEGNVQAKKLEMWLHDPRRYLTTMLIGNNIVNVALSILASLLVENVLLRMNVPSTSAYASGIAFMLVTFLLLTFGEIIPKNLSKEHAVTIAQRVIVPLDIIYQLIGPFVRLFVWMSNFVIRLVGGGTIKEVPVLTEEEIRTLIEVSEREGVIEEDEREMIHSIIDFGDTVVQEIMVPRVDIIGLDIEENTLEDARQLVIESGHSRIPVYEHDFDRILGFLYAKDLIGVNESEKSLRDLLRKCMFVPKAKRVSDLLQSFRREKMHIAIVVDEYGLTAGLVTIEDVLEEIVGDIQDEFDSEKPTYEVQDDGTIIADAKTNLDDLDSVLGIPLELPEMDYESLGGFITSYLGEVPKEGEEFEFENLRFTILAGDTRKVDRVRIVKISPTDETDSNGTVTDTLPLSSPMDDRSPRESLGA